MTQAVTRTLKIIVGASRKMKTASICLLLCVLSLAGCASTYTRMHPERRKSPNTYVYRGVRFLYSEWLFPEFSGGGGAPYISPLVFAIIPIGVIVDTPFSFAEDTICLPYDGYRAITELYSDLSWYSNYKKSTEPYHLRAVAAKDEFDLFIKKNGFITYDASTGKYTKPAKKSGWECWAKYSDGVMEYHNAPISPNKGIHGTR